MKKSETGILIRFLISAILGIVGGGILYNCLQKYGTINPYRAWESAIGYLCLLASGNHFRVAVFKAKKSKSFSDLEEGISVIVEKVTPLWEDEKEILFRRKRGETVYYKYNTISQGYFEEGKSYTICVLNLEERTDVIYQDGRKIYNLTPLRLPFTKFVCECESETIADKAEEFYEDNREEIDHVINVVNTKVKPAAQSGVRMVRTIQWILTGVLYIGGGIFLIYINAGKNIIVSWFVVLPLLSLFAYFGNKD